LLPNQSKGLETVGEIVVDKGILFESFVFEVEDTEDNGNIDINSHSILFILFLSSLLVLFFSTVDVDFCLIFVVAVKFLFLGI